MTWLKIFIVLKNSENICETPWHQIKQRSNCMICLQKICLFVWNRKKLMQLVLTNDLLFCVGSFV